jgi:hypothetical protein
MDSLMEGDMRLTVPGDIQKRLLFAFAAICLGPLAAEGQESDLPADLVANGGGSAVLSAPPPEGGAVRRYPVQFALVAGFDGQTPTGFVHFTFGRAFAQDWGAVPPNDALMVSGKVSAITQDDDGFVHLTGTLTEIDFTHGQGAVFLIDDLFDITLGGSLGPSDFVLQWCLLPEFPVRVTHGVLTVDGSSISARVEGSTPTVTSRIAHGLQVVGGCVRGQSR